MSSTAEVETDPLGYTYRRTGVVRTPEEGDYFLSNDVELVSPALDEQGWPQFAPNSEREIVTLDPEDQVVSDYPEQTEEGHQMTPQEAHVAKCQWLAHFYPDAVVGPPGLPVEFAVMIGAAGIVDKNSGDIIVDGEVVANVNDADDNGVVEADSTGDDDAPEAA